MEGRGVGGRIGEGEVCIDFLCGPRVYWLDSLDSYHFAKLDFRQLSGLRRASSGTSNAGGRLTCPRHNINTVGESCGRMRCPVPGVQVSEMNVVLARTRFDE